MPRLIPVSAIAAPAVLALTAAPPAAAQAGDEDRPTERAEQAAVTDGWLDVSARGVLTDRTSALTDDSFTGTGIGADIDGGIERQSGAWRLYGGASARVFDYTLDGIATRTSYGAELGAGYSFSEEFEVALEGSFVADTATLEAFSADQQRLRALMQWERGNDRLRGRVEYRRRTYDVAAQSEGDGWAFAAEYNRRLGSYHWIRASVVQDSIRSDDAFRVYDRVTGTLAYSRPLSRMVRLRGELEARRFEFDARQAQGAPLGETRRDTILSPEIGLDYGRVSGGPFARARARYDVRSSTDERFDRDLPRLDVEVGYRF